jgi:hypothetical protein
MLSSLSQQHLTKLVPLVLENAVRRAVANFLRAWPVCRGAQAAEFEMLPATPEARPISVSRCSSISLEGEQGKHKHGNRSIKANQAGNKGRHRCRTMRAASLKKHEAGNKGRCARQYAPLTPSHVHRSAYHITRMIEAENWRFSSQGANRGSRSPRALSWIRGW